MQIIWGNNSCTADHSSECPLVAIPTIMIMELLEQEWIMFFFIPPPPFYFGRRSEFELPLDNVWYDRVLLLFKFKFMHNDGHVREEQCAMMDVLYNYADGRYQRFSAHLKTLFY